MVQSAALGRRSEPSGGHRDLTWCPLLGGAGGSVEDRVGRCGLRHQGHRTLGAGPGRPGKPVLAALTRSIDGPARRRAPRQTTTGQAATSADGTRPVTTMDSSAPGDGLVTAFSEPDSSSCCPAGTWRLRPSAASSRFGGWASSRPAPTVEPVERGCWQLLEAASTLVDPRLYLQLSASGSPKTNSKIIGATACGTSRDPTGRNGSQPELISRSNWPNQAR